MSEMLSQLRKSLHTGFIDAETPSVPHYQPQLLHNSKAAGVKVLTSIREELLTCQAFDLTIAFITRSGIASLLETFKELGRKGIEGRILTTTFLRFNEPEALETLLGFSNCRVRIYDGSLHTKGYLFHHEEHCSLIIGSANLTASALSVNQEWNLKITSTEQGRIIRSVQDSFEQMWEDSFDLSPAWIEHYRKLFEAEHRQRETAAEQQQIEDLLPVEIEPNSMQSEALLSLQELRDRKERKALLISATGTGKTYLAALDVQHSEVSRCLYIAHRESILRGACRSFQKILPSGKYSYGILTGTTKDQSGASVLFASISTLCKEEVLRSFSADAFDYIIIDEAHRSRASSYMKVLEHFDPDFLLGMTATPERTDRKSIYELFDHNIAYSIRLQQALEAKLLCPFHYFGTSSLEIEGEDCSEDLGSFSHLAVSEQALRIHEQLGFYSMHERHRRGLIFCSTIAACGKLSEDLNRLGLKTLAVSGLDSQERRQRAVERLESTDEVDRLEYLITVDIFNEGIDIPSLNQVVMVRPTESAIIFVQQLGRGLRKAEGKDFLTVIDFIGNHKNNFLIPAALYGDISFNRDTLRKLVASESVSIPGTSTIQFDHIAREQIYASIDKAPVHTQQFLKQQYERRKVQLGRIPTLLDFTRTGEFDAHAFIRNYGSYRCCVNKMERRAETSLSQRHIQSLKCISREFAQGHRPHELLMLRELLEHGSFSERTISDIIASSYEFRLRRSTFSSASGLLDRSFFNKTADRVYGQLSYVERTGDRYQRTESFAQLCGDPAYRHELEDTIAFGLKRYEQRFLKGRSDTDLVLYECYSRKDVCRLLRWDKDLASVMNGYFFKDTVCPIFVTYHKHEDTKSSILYDDEFIDNQTFSWMTKNNRTLSSKDCTSIMQQGETGLRIPLFIKKHDNEGNDFYFMGDLTYLPGQEQQTDITTSKGNRLPIVNFKFSLDPPVRDDIYRYITRYITGPGIPEKGRNSHGS